MNDSSITTRNDISSYINQELNLSPPSVNLFKGQRSDDDDDDDDDNDDEHLELWTLQLPTEVPLSELHGVEFSTEDLQNVGRSALRIKTKKDGEQYQLQEGNQIENDSFRVLVSQETATTSGDDEERHGRRGRADDDGSSQEDSKKKSDSNRKKPYLYPSSKPFTRHLKLLKRIPQVSEAQLAPLKGPVASDPMRHAYAPIPQRRGLKRRWMPLGVPQPIHSTIGTLSSNTSDYSSHYVQKATGGKPFTNRSTNGRSLHIEPSADDDYDDVPPKKRLKTDETSDKMNEGDHKISSPGDGKLTGSKEERKTRKEQRNAKKKSAKKEKKSKKEKKGK